MASEEQGLVYGWCWTDPVCLSAAVAVASAFIATARRLDTIEQFTKGRKRLAAILRHLAAGGVISGGASFGLCLIGASTWPGQHKTIAALVILAALIVDWGSDSGRTILRRLILTLVPAQGGGRAADLETPKKWPDEITDSEKDSNSSFLEPPSSG